MTLVLINEMQRLKQKKINIILRECILKLII